MIRRAKLQIATATSTMDMFVCKLNVLFDREKRDFVVLWNVECDRNEQIRADPSIYYHILSYTITYELYACSTKNVVQTKAVVSRGASVIRVAM